MNEIIPLDSERWQNDNNPASQEIASRKMMMDRRMSEDARVKGLETAKPEETGLNCSWCKEAMD